MQEVQGGEGELAGGSFGTEGDRRGELHGGYGGAALMAGDSGSGHRGKLGRAPGAGRGVEGEVGGLLAKQMEGRRARRGRKRAEEVAHGTARRVVAVARRAAVLGVRAGR